MCRTRRLMRRHAHSRSGLSARTRGGRMRSRDGGNRPRRGRSVDERRSAGKPRRGRTSAAGSGREASGACRERLLGKGRRAGPPRPPLGACAGHACDGSLPLSFVLLQTPVIDDSLRTSEPTCVPLAHSKTARRPSVACAARSSPVQPLFRSGLPVDRHCRGRRRQRAARLQGRGPGPAALCSPIAANHAQAGRLVGQGGAFACSLACSRASRLPLFPRRRVVTHDRHAGRGPGRRAAGREGPIVIVHVLLSRFMHV